jgi:hypothetical protein
MKLPHRLAPVALAFAAAVGAAPVSAQLYKWVDEKGATHYSDRKPDDQKSADKVKSVENAPVSVYSPDKTLLKAVETARERASRPEPPPEPQRIARPYVAPVNPQPVPNDPCASADCGADYYSYAPVYATGRHGQRLQQAVLPAGATAGTVNSPGIIPGNSGTTPTGTAGHPAPQRQPSSSRPRPPQHSAHTEPLR